MDCRLRSIYLHPLEQKGCEVSGIRRAVVAEVWHKQTIPWDSFTCILWSRKDVRSVGSEEQSLLRSGLNAAREEDSGTRAFFRGRRFSRAVTWTRSEDFKSVIYYRIHIIVGSICFWAFGVIVGVKPTVVQWPGLTLEEPPSWSHESASGSIGQTYGSRSFYLQSNI